MDYLIKLLKKEKKKKLTKIKTKKINVANERKRQNLKVTLSSIFGKLPEHFEGKAHATAGRKIGRPAVVMRTLVMVASTASLAQPRHHGGAKTDAEVQAGVVHARLSG